MSIVLIVLMTAVFIVCCADSASAVVGEDWLFGKLYDSLWHFIITTPFDKIKEKAEKGEPEARYILGIMYLFGEEIPVHYSKEKFPKNYKVHKDYEEAFKWLDKAARANDYKEAQCLLGYMYDKGIWIQQNKAEAIIWYSKAAEQGYAEAQYRLGVMYENGDVRKLRAERQELQRKQQGNGFLTDVFSAPFRLIDELVNILLDDDKSEAVAWYRKAARQDFTPAQDALKRLGETW